MKKAIFYRLLQLLLCILPLQFISCENSDEEEPGNPLFSDSALTFTVLNCERVGRSLVVDFEMTNKTGKVLQNLCIQTGYSIGLSVEGFLNYPTDDLGHYYPQNEVGYGKVMHDTRNVIAEVGGTPVIGHFVIPLFDLDNQAKTITIHKLVRCDNYEFEGVAGHGILRLDNIPIVDKRKNIWLPDRTLVFESGTWHDANNGYNDIIIEFTIRNNCDEPLDDLTLIIGRDNNGDTYGLTDSNGKSYWGFISRTFTMEHDGKTWEQEEEIPRRELRQKGGEWTDGYLHLSLGQWGKVQCEVILRDYNGSDELSMTLGCSTDERYLEDGYAIFHNISVIR